MSRLRNRRNLLCTRFDGKLVPVWGTCEWNNRGGGGGGNVLVTSNEEDDRKMKCITN